MKDLYPNGNLEVGCTKEYVPLVTKINDRIASGDQFFSLEFFPPKTPNGVANFLHRLDRLKEGGPLFVDVTWHMGSDPGSEKETSSSSIADACLNYVGVETMLHVTNAQYTKEQTLKHLERAKDLGLRNILALRGDLPPGDDKKLPDYKYKATDLVQWIREEYNDYFGICVAGYPTGHPDAVSYEADLLNLKQKQDNGAQFVITQLFFDHREFEKFVKDARNVGVTIPIIPGIMPILGYDNIRRIASLSKLVIPQDILDALEPIKHNDEAVRNYGVHKATEMCRKLLENRSAPSLHMYTLNKESATREILSNLGLWQKTSIRSLPWKPHADHPKRCTEDVRPIFWSSRPKSYIYRTRDWDEYPNGRWGNSSSPAYGTLKDYYLFYLKGEKPKEELRAIWGEEINQEEDIWQVFYAFVTGTENKDGHKVTKLPWSEEEEMSPETVIIKDQLATLNKNGVLTINSQPAVNGAPSSDPLVGWGNPGGYCYQKAYLEFFTPRKHAEALYALVKDSTRVNYHIINRDGSIDWTNASGNNPMAVTWGVFPGSEVAQPTVVDPLSFRVWKDEAFEAWNTHWASIYPDGSQSQAVLRGIQENYCLVTLVDNDFPSNSCLWDLLNNMLKEVESASVEK